MFLLRKKWVVVLILIAVLLPAGKFGYDKLTDFLAYKMISEIAKNSRSLNANLQQGDIAPPAPSPEIKEEETSEDAETPPPQKSTENTSPPGNQPDILKRMSADDKSYVMGIYGRFSSSEVAEVSKILAGGLTPEGKARIKQIVFSKISSDEYNKLLAIYNKYN